MKLNYREALLEFEQQYLNSLIAKSKGNVAEASRLSGINRTHIYKMCERANVELKPAISMHRDVSPIQVVRQEGSAEWQAMGR